MHALVLYITLHFQPCPCYAEKFGKSNRFVWQVHAHAFESIMIAFLYSVVTVYTHVFRCWYPKAQNFWTHASRKSLLWDCSIEHDAHDAHSNQWNAIHATACAHVTSRSSRQFRLSDYIVFDKNNIIGIISLLLIVHCLHCTLVVHCSKCMVSNYVSVGNYRKP